MTQEFFLYLPVSFLLHNMDCLVKKNHWYYLQKMYYKFANDIEKSLEEKFIS